MSWKHLLYASLTTDFVLAPLRLRNATAVAVLAYHELADDDVDLEAWTVVRKSAFLRQVDYLVRHYDIVTLDQALAHIEAGGVTDRPKAVITFDDGASGNARILLPLVEQLRVPVTVYIATRQIADQNPYWFDHVINALQIDRVVDLDLRQFNLGEYRINVTRGPENWREIERLLEALKSLAPEVRVKALEALLAEIPPVARRNCRIEPMSVADVKALAACPFITIGSHSHCHNLLTQLAPAAVTESIRESKTLLERWTGKTIEHFAYPNGSYDDNTVRIVQASGFRSATTFEARLWRSDDSHLRIPRIGIGRYDSIEQFKLNLVGGLRRFWTKAA